MLKGLFKSKRQSEVITFNPIEINYNEYDSDNISSTFVYAVLKYGESICDDSNRLKNILSDLAPHLSREIKLLQYLSKGIGLNKILNAGEKEDAELLIWVNNAISYLVNNEMIDEKVAYEFCIDLVCDIAGRDISDAYLKGKEEKAREKEILNILEYAKRLIAEEKYDEADEKLREVCERAVKEEVIQEATALIETVAEYQLTDIVKSITGAIGEGRYRDACNNIEVANKLVNKCGDCKNVKDLSYIIKKNEEKIDNVIKNCFKNADKAIKRKEYDKASIFVDQVKEISGNYFHMDDMCSFWIQRICIEKLIDNRDFEIAIQKINELRQNVGLEKKFSKYIISLERKIKGYNISLIFFKLISAVLFGIILVYANIKEIFVVEKSIQLIINTLWVINVGIIIVKSKRRRKLFYDMLILLSNYGVGLLMLWCANSRMDIIPISIFAVALPIMCTALLLVNEKKVKCTKIIIGNIGIVILLIVTAISVQCFLNKDESYVDESIVESGVSYEPEVNTVELQNNKTEEYVESGNYREDGENNTFWDIDMNMIFYAMATNYSLDEFIADIQIEPFERFSYQDGGSKGLFYTTFGEFTGELHYSDTDEIAFYLETDEPIVGNEVSKIFNAVSTKSVDDDNQIFVWNDKVEMDVYYNNYCTSIYFSIYENNISSSEEENVSGEWDVCLEDINEMFSSNYTFEQIKSKYPTGILTEVDNYLLEYYGYVGTYKGYFSYCSGCPVYGIGDINSEYEHFSWTSEIGTWCSDEYLCEEWGLTYLDSGYREGNGTPITIYEWNERLVVVVLQAEGSHTLIQILPIANYQINYW